MNALYNHKTISFCLPGGKADHTPPTASPLMPCIWGILDFRSIGVTQSAFFKMMAAGPS